jgi:hypothetical protein
LINERLLAAAFTLRNDSSKRDARAKAVVATPVGEDRPGKEQTTNLKDDMSAATAISIPDIDVNMNANAKTPSAGINIQLFEDSLPPVFRSSTSLSDKVTNELKRYHKYVGTILYYSETFPRAYRVRGMIPQCDCGCRSMYNIFVICFLLFLFYFTVGIVCSYECAGSAIHSGFDVFCEKSRRK